MKITSDHQIDVAKQIFSPNHSKQKFPPEIIVLHCISLPEGHFGNDNIIELFTNKLDCKKEEFSSLKGLKVSSHLLINRNGEILQFVPFNKTAWHAGVSQYKGRENCNDFSIGIELEGTIYEKFTEEQYLVLNDVLGALKQKYNIKDIVGHSDIAPDRKQDPGQHFQWERINV